MIPFNFEYDRPADVQGAVRLFQRRSSESKQPHYLSGGTEIITLGRRNLLHTQAVVDIKSIHECQAVAMEKNKLTLGSAITLSKLYDSRVFPFLGAAAAGVADRTSRNKITLGGNVCGRIMYREAVLPLLVTDSELRIAGPDGYKQVPIHEVFDQYIRLRKGELLLQSVTDKRFIDMPYQVLKKRKASDIDYPIVTVAAIRADDGIRVAFSGLTNFPFRSQQIERILNAAELPLDSRIDQAVSHVPGPVISDIRASAEYREWIVKNALREVMQSLGGA